MDLNKILRITKQQKFLYDVSLLENSNGPFSIIDIEKACGFNFPQPDIRKIINLLEEREILIPVKESPVRYIIKNKKLIKIIKRGESYLIHSDYIPTIKTWAIT